MQTFYVEEVERFFRDKDDAKSYFVQKKLNGNIYVDESGSEISENHYMYEINVKIDLRLIGRTKIDNICVLLKGDEEAYTNSPTLNYGNIYSNGMTATSAVLNASAVDFVHDLIVNQYTNSHILTKIDALQFIDVNRYKNNFRGSPSDKYGLVRELKTYLEQRPAETIKSETTITDLSAIRSHLSTLVERSLYEGRSLVKALNFKAIRSSPPATRHVITLNEQYQKDINNLKSEINDLGEKPNPELLAALNEQVNTVRAKAMAVYSDSPFRKVSFLLTIKESDLINSKIDFDEFYVCLEAKDIQGITVDTQMIKIDLERDLLMDAISFEGISISEDNEDDKFVINIENNTVTDAQFDLYYKQLKKDIAFYKNKFSHTRSLTIPASSKNGRFLIPKGFRFSGGSSATVVNGTGLADIPKFYRITPRMGSLDFDNMYEFAQSPKKIYKNTHIPFAIINGIQGSQRMFNEIVLDTGHIPVKYRKLKILKKDISRYVFSDNSNLKNVAPVGSTNRLIDISNERNLTTTISTIKDYDVREDAFYEYRLELLDDVGRVEKIYSTTFFQEMITRPSSRVELTADCQRPPASSQALLTAQVRVQETSSDQILNQSHRDLYDLFRDEIKEIRDDISKTIVIGVERINIDKSEIDFLGYRSDVSSHTVERGRRGSFNYANFSFYDDLPESQGNYIYKLTSYVKPVMQIIAAVNEELESRATMGSQATGLLADPSLIGEAYANIRRKVSLIESSILSHISDKYSTKEARLGLIVDPETRRYINRGDAYGSASTGNVNYTYALGTLAPESNIVEDVNIIPHQTRNINNRDPAVGIGDTKHKFIINFKGLFNRDVDHCAVFLRSIAGLDFCCNMHVDHEKTDYRVLIEKNNLRGDLEFLLYPISMTGKVKTSHTLGTISIGH